MSDFVLSCCSTVDLSNEKVLNEDIKYACFHYSLDGCEYRDDMGKTQPLEEFYKTMVAGADTKTSQINADEFCEYFSEFLKEGKDILHVSLSSGLSGVSNSAMIAKSMLEDEYPDRKIYVVDSLAASSGYGLIMTTLAKKKRDGMGIDELFEWIEEHKLNMHHWFYTDDLKFFIRGGRVSKTSGFVGTMLNICPLLNIDVEGKLIPRLKVRTKKKVMLTCINEMLNNAEDGADYSGDCFISHAYCYEDAKLLQAAVEENFKNQKGKVEIFPIGTTIGSHTGPGTVALFFWGKKRDN